MYQRFERNALGRDFIVGDIHGCFTRLQAELHRIGFNPATDRLFSVGDLVDRGPESQSAVDWLGNNPWFHAVRGNHEDMAIRWPNGHMDAGNYAANGGAWMMALDRETQLETSATFKSLPVAIELDTELGLVGIVHAECPLASWLDFRSMLTDESLSNNKRDALVDMALWSRERITSRFDGEVEGVRAVVVGHTPMQQPARLGNVIYIDTGAVFGRSFTILDAATLQPV